MVTNEQVPLSVQHFISGFDVTPLAYLLLVNAILLALGCLLEGSTVLLIIRREEMYHRSYVSKVATAVIAGLGPGGYRAAVKALLQMLRDGTT